VMENQAHKEREGRSCESATVRADRSKSEQYHSIVPEAKKLPRPLSTSSLHHQGSLELGMAFLKRIRTKLHVFEVSSGVHEFVGSFLDRDRRVRCTGQKQSV
jgi:hypothetical protein